MIEYKRPTQNKETNPEIPNVCIIGIGGAGINVLDRIAIEDNKNTELYVLDTDSRALDSSISSNKIQIGKTITKGLGTGADPELGKRAIRESEDEIRAILEKTEMLFLISGLGGGTSCGVMPYITDIASEMEIFIVSIIILPFSFEGERRHQQAFDALRKIKQTSNAILTFENDKMGELVLAKEGVQKAFAAAEKLICQSAKSIVELMAKSDALISISIADVLASLRNDDSRCLFGYGASSGKNRNSNALKNALKSPLLDKGELLNYAKDVIVHITGGEDTTLFEVEKLMEELHQSVNLSAHIYLGLSINKSYKDKLCLTILSSLSSEKMQQLKEEAEQKENLSKNTENTTDNNTINKTNNDIKPKTKKEQDHNNEPEEQNPNQTTEPETNNIDKITKQKSKPEPETEESNEIEENPDKEQTVRLNLIPKNNPQTQNTPQVQNESPLENPQAPEKTITKETFFDVTTENELETQEEEETPEQEQPEIQQKKEKTTKQLLINPTAENQSADDFDDNLDIPTFLRKRK